MIVRFFVRRCLFDCVVWLVGVSVPSGRVVL